MLGSDTPRRVQCNLASPVVVYTDACGEGHLGVTIYLDGCSIVAHTHAPAWLCGLGIGVLEQAATVLGLCLAAEVAPGRNILLFCDNTGAMNTVIRGYSKSAYARGLSSVFWAVAAKANVLVWVEYVKSGLNLGDAPSRVCNLYMFQYLGTIQIPITIRRSDNGANPIYQWFTNNTQNLEHRRNECLKENKCVIPMNNIGVPSSFYQALESRGAYDNARYGIRAIPRGVRGGRKCS